MLLVDDIDFLNGKSGIQEEFLHTFGQLASHDRQIVVAADRHPRLLDVCEELTTRFMSGLACRLEAPDAETRRRIAASHAARLSVGISDDAISFVADRFTSNIRELEGALNCLSTWADMTGKTVTASAARHVLAGLEQDCRRLIRMTDIETVVCQAFGVRPQDLKSSSRSPVFTRPRMLAMYLARKHIHAPYREIGRHFGGRNHSTVVAATKRVRSWLESETTLTIASHRWQVGALIEFLEAELRAG